MKIAYIYLNAHMSNGHSGLKKMLKKPLKKNEVAIFVNSAFDTVKLLVGDQFVAHYKHQGRIDPATIRHLPNYLNGGSIDYTKALERTIDNYFESRK